MERMIVNYIGFYDLIENSNENRNACLSATNKMNYISKVLNKLNYDVHYISPSWTTNKKFYRGKKTKINKHSNLLLFPTIPWSTPVLKLLSVIFSYSNITYYLLFKIKKNEKIIAYHSRWLSLPLIIMKLLRPKLELILEVEEIYNDVSKSSFWKIMEYKLFKHADKYIFPTNLLNEKINFTNKPSIVIHGTYQVEERKKVRFEDDKIHVVYAGTFDPTKGGDIAVAATEFLPEKYHVHIIGFGSTAQIEQIKNIVKKVNIKSKAIVTYDGLLTGSEYIRFLQRCHIGLSTQIPDAEYNFTSFPSKILSYMSNGLQVVTIRLKSIEESAISNYVYYYDVQDPMVIAETIIKVNATSNNDMRSFINKLDKNFRNELMALLVRKY